MKYDVTIVVNDHRGRPMKLSQESDAGATLRDMLEIICLAQTEVVKTADDKLKIYRILQRTIAADPILELEAAEVTLLKKVIGAAYPPMVLGTLYDLLESPIGGKKDVAPPEEDSAS